MILNINYKGEKMEVKTTLGIAVVIGVLALFVSSATARNLLDSAGNGNSNFGGLSDFAQENNFQEQHSQDFEKQITQEFQKQIAQDFEKQDLQRENPQSYSQPKKQQNYTNSNKHSNKALSPKEFLKQYGGVYVLNKEYRDFIKENEKIIDKKREEVLNSAKGMSNEEYREYTKKVGFTSEWQKSMRVLPNGCRYYWGKASPGLGRYSEEEERLHGEDFKKIREFIGEANWNKYKYGSAVTSTFWCGKENTPEAKIYALTIILGISEVVTDYGLFGDSGMGFSLSRNRSTNETGDNVFEYINGTFIKSSEISEGLE